MYELHLKMKIFSRASLIGVILFMASCGLEKKAAKSFELAQFQAAIDTYNNILA